MVRNATIRPGRSCPLGATLSPQGVNFSVFSKSATLVELLLFTDVQDAPPGLVNLLGLQPRVLLRPAPGVQLAPGPDGPHGRVPLCMDQYEVYTGVMPVVQARTYLTFIPDAHNVLPYGGTKAPGGNWTGAAACGRGEPLGYRA